jgi:hypothetical protein
MSGIAAPGTVWGDSERAAGGSAVAYDPALTSFIIVGLVGGVAVVMSAAPGWESSHELARATDHWTAPVVSRTFPLDAGAQERLNRETAILEGHGYRIVLRREVATSSLVAGGSIADEASGAGPDGAAGDGPSRELPAEASDRTIVITYRLS